MRTAERFFEQNKSINQIHSYLSIDKIPKSKGLKISRSLRNSLTQNIYTPGPGFYEVHKDDKTKSIIIGRSKRNLF